MKRIKYSANDEEEDPTGGKDEFSSSGGVLKTVPIIRDFSLNPRCSHGPTVLFERSDSRFFACSAYRSRKLCSFMMTEEKWNKLSSRANSGDQEDDDSSENEEDDTDEEETTPKKRKLPKEKSQLNHPLVVPNHRDKGEAQYHFNQPTLDFVLATMANLKIDSVLCIGTPSLHQQLVEANSSSSKTAGDDGSPAIRSFLLDIDPRFVKSVKEDHFNLYNMCNHHFFREASDPPPKYRKFLRRSKNLAVIVDPPFGVKAELIWNGCLLGVNRDLTQIRNTQEGKTDVIEEGRDCDLNFKAFWIFPYFMEGHILKSSLGKLAMSDFHVEYSNHAKYNGSSSRSKSSPIRIFTSVPLSNLTLPDDEYRYCEFCDKWVDKQNRHCGTCASCPTKDGGPSYRHCQRCSKCVKPTWKHCSACGSCHLKDNPCHNTNHQEKSTVSGNSALGTRFPTKYRKNPHASKWTPSRSGSRQGRDNRQFSRNIPRSKMNSNRNHHHDKKKSFSRNRQPVQKNRMYNRNKN